MSGKTTRIISTFISNKGHISRRIPSDDGIEAEYGVDNVIIATIAFCFAFALVVSLSSFLWNQPNQPGHSSVTDLIQKRSPPAFSDLFTTTLYLSNVLVVSAKFLTFFSFRQRIQLIHDTVKTTKRYSSLPANRHGHLSLHHGKI